MPLYEYRCPQCGERFEKLVRFSDSDTPQSCPRCSLPAERRVSAPAARITVSGGSCAPSGGG